MSIQIQKTDCTGCGKCIEACPGNLIKKDSEGKACIRHPRDCWGCTSCVKECAKGAILFYLSVDVGGKGSTLSVSEKDDIRIWEIKSPYGNSKSIRVNKKDANKY